MRFRNTPGVSEEIRCVGFWRAALAECLGTFLLQMMISTSWLRWYEDVPLEGAAGAWSDGRVVLVSLSAGLAVTALVQGFGHISGGHLNPAVTAAMLCGRKISLLRAAVYVIAQCTGAVAGSLLVYGVTPAPYQQHLAATTPGPLVTPGAAVAVELLLSVLHVFTICATVDPFVQIPGSASLAIGLTVTAAHLVGLRYTGCSLNPARSLGPAVVTGVWEKHWIYWVGPLGGAVLAILVYDYIFNPSSQSNNICNMESVYEVQSSRSTLASMAAGGGGLRSVSRLTDTTTSSGSHVVLETHPHHHHQHHHHARADPGNTFTTNPDTIRDGLSHNHS